MLDNCLQFFARLQFVLLAIVSLLVFPWRFIRSLWYLCNLQKWKTYLIGRARRNCVVLIDSTERLQGGLLRKGSQVMSENPVLFDLYDSVRQGAILHSLVLPYYRLVQPMKWIYKTLDGPTRNRLTRILVINEQDLKLRLVELIYDNYIIAGLAGNVNDESFVRSQILFERYQKKIDDERQHLLDNLVVAKQDDALEEVGGIEPEPVPERPMTCSVYIALKIFRHFSKEAILDVLSIVSFAFSIFFVYRWRSLFREFGRAKNLSDKRNAILNNGSMCFADIMFFFQFLVIVLTVYRIPEWLKIYSAVSEIMSSEDSIAAMYTETRIIFFRIVTSFGLDFIRASFMIVPRILKLLKTTGLHVYTFYVESVDNLMNVMGNFHVSHAFSHVISFFISIYAFLGSLVAFPVLFYFSANNPSSAFLLILLDASSFFLALLAGFVKGCQTPRYLEVESPFGLMERMTFSSFIKFSFLIYDLFQKTVLSLAGSGNSNSSTRDVPTIISIPGLGTIDITGLMSYLRGLSQEYDTYAIFVSVFLVVVWLVLSSGLVQVSDESKQRKLYSYLGLNFSNMSLWNSFASKLSNQLFMFICINLTKPIRKAFTGDYSSWVGSVTLCALAAYVLTSVVAITSQNIFAPVERPFTDIRFPTLYILGKNSLTLIFVLCAVGLQGSLFLPYVNLVSLSLILYWNVFGFKALSNNDPCTVRYFSFIQGFGTSIAMWVNVVNILRSNDIFVGQLSRFLISGGFGVWVVGSVLIAVIEQKLTRSKIKSSQDFKAFESARDRLMDHYRMLKESNGLVSGWTAEDDKRFTKHLQKRLKPIALQRDILSLEESVRMERFSPEFLMKKKEWRKQQLLDRWVQYNDLVSTIERFIAGTGRVPEHNFEPKAGDDRFIELLKASELDVNLSIIAAEDSWSIITAILTEARMVKKLGHHMELMVNSAHDTALKLLGKNVTLEDYSKLYKSPDSIMNSPTGRKRTNSGGDHDEKESERIFLESTTIHSGIVSVPFSVNVEELKE
jgi:hypothetical protein